MDAMTRPSPDQINRARIENPKVRERDLAAQLGISEAELVAARCGEGVVRLEPRVGDLLNGLTAVGEVMALTRNESVVHEKIGVYANINVGKQHAIVLNRDIDLRIFPTLWKHGFAVEKGEGEDIRYSLQFFDAAGDAVHKVHMRPASNLEAYRRLVESLRSADQSRTVELGEVDPEEHDDSAPVDLDELRRRWSAMKDVHQFFGMLRKFKLSRYRALELIGDDFAWPLDPEAVSALINHAANDGLPIMAFVGNRACVQIHTGPVTNIKPMGPWLNVMDETFHMHLRLDHIAEVWAVRKPTRDGHVTSVEAFDADRNLIIQFFGERKEGEEERKDWRFLAENLPRVAGSSTAA
jgi:putative hemin transport protein